MVMEEKKGQTGENEDRQTDRQTGDPHENLELKSKTSNFLFDICFFIKIVLTRTEQLQGVYIVPPCQMDQILISINVVWTCV